MSGALPDLTFDAPSADVLAADGAFWQLYDSSFPANEREPRSVILETLRSGAGLTVRARGGATNQYSQRGLSAAGMVWEVDIPECATTESGQQQSRRRIAFFTRLGGSLLPTPYFQPPVDGISSVPMHLMFWPAPGGPLPDVRSRSALVRALYFEKYHQANGIPQPVLEDLLRRTEIASAD